MTTLRQAHKRNYTCYENKLPQNNDLSLRARGMMFYLLSLPDDWKIHLNHLNKVLKEGRKAITAILNELKRAGYIHHQKMGFKEGWQYFVFESPITTDEFKEFLRTLPVLEQFAFANNSPEGVPLQSNNSSTKKPLDKENPPLTPPSSSSSEEDFSKSKKMRENVLLLDEAKRRLELQPLGHVKNKKKWIDATYDNLEQEGLMNELVNHRKHFCEKYGLGTVTSTALVIYSGALVEEHPFWGDEEFWISHKIGIKDFEGYKLSKRLDMT